MKKEGKTKLKGKINTKKEAKETIDKFKSVSGEWEVDHKTNKMRVTFDGQIKEDGMGKSGLTAADKEWIADLVISTVKPIKEDISSLKEDVKALKEDMVQVKKDIKAIKECPTIKKELKKDDK